LRRDSARNGRQLNDETAHQIITTADRAWREWIRGHLDRIATRYPPRLPVDPNALADLVFATNEGAYVLARATGEDRYLELLFSPTEPAAVR
jgi:hypothetical protein